MIFPTLKFLEKGGYLMRVVSLLATLALLAMVVGLSGCPKSGGNAGTGGKQKINTSLKYGSGQPPSLDAPDVGSKSGGN